MLHRKWIALLLSFCLLLSIVPTVAAKSSSEIQDEIDRLEEEADEIQAQLDSLEGEISVTNENLTVYASEKLRIDQEAELLRRTAENITAQIQEYSALISERQAELDELELAHEELQSRYQMRMRTIQERGKVSIWSVILSAEDFSDMLADSVMIEEIAQADQRMLQELQDSANKILAAKGVLAEQKALLESKKLDLEETNKELEAKRAEANEMIASLNADRERLREEIIAAEELEAELVAEIAQKEKEYTAAQLAENGGVSGFYTESGFIFPVAVSGFVYLSSPYGMRYHPITGNYTMHNGVDFAAYMGTPIYASKSGVVTTATMAGGWGNYVVINHGDGFSTLYAHMTYYTVSYNEYVEQGEVIGYVGSTGNSTGPHLHFTMYYDGSTVNPMNYVRLP